MIRFIVVLLFVIKLVDLLETNYANTIIVSSTLLPPTNACWTDEEQCLILGTFTRNTEHSYPVNLQCDERTQMNAGIFDTRFHNVEGIELNGCKVNRENTIGIETIPDAESVLRLSVLKFQATNFSSINFKNFKNLQRLDLRNNIINEIFNCTFMELKNVTILNIENNMIAKLGIDAFMPMHQLTHLTIIEPALKIPQTINISSITSLDSIVLSVHCLEWPKQFPMHLQHIEINQTNIDFRNLSTIFDDLNDLQTVAIINNTKISNLPKINSFNLKVLNLSKNSIDDLKEMMLNNLETLDVSWNRLKAINALQFRAMPRLINLLLNSNQIDTVAEDAFLHNKQLKNIDLTGNRLRKLYINIPLELRKSVFIHINDNPWSCNWITNCSSQFDRFKFDITNDKINNRGLKCEFNEGESDINQQLLFTTEYPFDQFTELSKKRNPRDTAILTLIILVSGVAMLFFLLFLHIKCRKKVPQPFYRTLPYQTRFDIYGTTIAPPPIVPLTGRSDIVRRVLPPTDYETPINCDRHINRFSTFGADINDLIYEEIPDEPTLSQEVLKKVGEIELNTLNPMYGHNVNSS